MSRMKIYRIMAGENTTVDSLKKISAATGGVVTLSELAGEKETSQ